MKGSFRGVLRVLSIGVGVATINIVMTMTPVVASMTLPINLLDCYEPAVSVLVVTLPMVVLAPVQATPVDTRALSALFSRLNIKVVATVPPQTTAAITPSTMPTPALVSAPQQPQHSF